MIQGINYDDTFEYNRANYYQEYTAATKDIVIESLKTINGFGKDRSGGKDVYKASDFSKSTVNDYIKYANNEIIYFIDQKTNTVFAALTHRATLVGLITRNKI